MLSRRQNGLSTIFSSYSSIPLSAAILYTRWMIIYDFYFNAAINEEFFQEQHPFRIDDRIRDDEDAQTQIHREDDDNRDIKTTTDRDVRRYRLRR